MTAFATVTGRTTLHIVPNGNMHARCGRVATDTVEGPAAATDHVCKTCLKVKAPRDLSPRTETVEVHATTWSVVDENTHRILTTVAADGYQGALQAARKALPFTHFDGLILSRV